jgi:hypothetical protein
MPNWCDNTLNIQGPADTLKNLWDEANKTGLLNAMVPMPKELEGTTSPTPKGSKQPKVDGFDNWYDWRIANWGCKWDVDMEGLQYIDYGDGTATIEGWFASPWAPPTNAYDTFLDDTDNCSLESFYEEGGHDYAGHYDNGSDDCIVGIEDYARKVVRGGASGSSLYDFLDGELGLTKYWRNYIEDDQAHIQAMERSNV